MRRVSLLLAVAASAAAFCTPSATVGALAMRPRVIDARSLRSPRTSTFRMESAGSSSARLPPKRKQEGGVRAAGGHL